jgi:integrase
MRSRVDLAERTVELYRWLLDRHIEPTFGSRRIEDIAPSDVRSWHADAARQHPTTAAKAYRLFSSIKRTAVADELIRRNPCQVRGAAVERAPERPVATIAEVGALAAAMPPELRIAVVLAAWWHLRRGEVRGLRRRDLDLEGGTLQVNITKTTAMSGRSIIKEPKTQAGRRTVAIPPHILERVNDHMDRYVGASLDDIVVEGSNRSLSVAWDHARLKVGRPELRFHDLRHSGLTWSAATGASIAELMRRAGHASQAAALRYQHATATEIVCWLTPSPTWPAKPQGSLRRRDGRTARPQLVRWCGWAVVKGTRCRRSPRWWSQLVVAQAAARWATIKVPMNL